MDSIARQRDLGLPADVAQKITEMVWRNHAEGLAGWKNLVGLVYSQQLRGLGAGALGAMMANQCIQEGVRANRSAHQPIDPAIAALQGRMVDVMRAATDDPKIGPNLDLRQTKIEERLEAVLPRETNETEDAWHARIEDISQASIAPATARAQMERFAEADRQLQAERAAEAQRQQAQREAEARQEAERQAQLREAERAKWAAENPEEVARQARLRAAQAQREAAQQARLDGWQVIHRRERTCQPLAEYIPGATDPADALRRIRMNDPDAGFAPDGQWPNSQGIPFAELDTTAGRVMLAQNFNACRNLFQLFRW